MFSYKTCFLLNGMVKMALWLSANLKNPRMIRVALGERGMKSNHQICSKCWMVLFMLLLIANKVEVARGGNSIQIQEKEAKEAVWLIFIKAQ